MKTKSALKEKSWRENNRRRGELIDKKIADTLTKDEQDELKVLQECMERYLDEVEPIDFSVLEKLERICKESNA